MLLRPNDKILSLTGLRVNILINDLASSISAYTKFLDILASTVCNAAGKILKSCALRCKLKVQHCYIQIKNKARMKFFSRRRAEGSLAVQM
jgi:hypothetical protein